MKLSLLNVTTFRSSDSGETMCKADAMNNLTDEPPRKLPRKRAAKKQAAKYKKAPGAPRRFKSAFIFFSTEKHKEIRTSLGEKGSKEKTTNVAKMVSEAWKSLSAEDREYWDDRARRDKERYEVEKSLYDGPWKVPAQKASKDPNAPKRPMSAFLSYSNSKRSNVKRENPGLTNAEVSRVLASMWKQCTEIEKQSYIDEEFGLRQKYKVAIADWRANEEKEKDVQRKMREEMALRTLEAHKRQMHDQEHHSDEMARHHRDQSSLPSLQVPPHMSSVMGDRGDGMGRASLPSHHHHDEDNAVPSGMDLLGQHQMQSNLGSPYGGGYSNDPSMSSLLGSSPYNAAQSLYDHQQALMSSHLQHQQHQQQWGGREPLNPRTSSGYNSASGGAAGVPGSRNAALLDALTAQNMSNQRYGSSRYGSNYGTGEEYQGRGDGFNNFFDPSSGY